MIARCTNENHRYFKDYGGRGIAVCRRWIESFDDFLADVGCHPGDGYELDRVNNDGDYCPDNVRWATKKQQQRNKRSNRFLEFMGERLTVSEWGERLGLHKHTIRHRLSIGWSVEAALTSPVRYKSSKLASCSPVVARRDSSS